jgi:alanine-synthesizing transaminase
LSFFERVVEIAKQHGIWVVHDLAYADLVFDGYTAPSILQVPGAREIAVEFFTLSKSYNMPGWRVGFCCGNSELIAGADQDQILPRLRHFHASAGRRNRRHLRAINNVCAIFATCTVGVATCCVRVSMRRAGPVEPPKATMFVWA